MEEAVERGINDAQSPDDAGEDPAITGEEMPDDYYRSQAEVDTAFSKRLEREKKKWEQQAREEAEAQINGILNETEGADAAPGGEENAFDTEQFIERIGMEEKEIQREDPGFDMLAEMNQNPMFALMAASGLPLKKVYEFFHSEEKEGALRKRVEQEIIGKIRSRNIRPAPIHPAGGGAMKDISKMSESEILEIDARVRRGERVVL